MVGRFEVFTLGLSEIMSSWNKIAAEEMKAFGLKGTYVIYLIALYKHPEGLTAANLSEKCNRDKAEVSRAIASFEKNGLVKGKTLPLMVTEQKLRLLNRGENLPKPSVKE